HVLISNVHVIRVHLTNISKIACFSSPVQSVVSAKRAPYQRNLVLMCVIFTRLPYARPNA
ncbi:MAG: hypothetical protein ACKPKO_32980, partial [Candidatus Fonsibacter sp.]